MLSYYSEGVQLAQRMERDGGYKAFILSYRIQPNTYPQCQMDLALAIMHVRAHARQYGIDENRILVVGASAGGHLCASTAMLHEELKTEIFCVHPELVKLYGRISRGGRQKHSPRNFPANVDLLILCNPNNPTSSVHQTPAVVRRNSGLLQTQIYSPVPVVDETLCGICRGTR